MSQIMKTYLGVFLIVVLTFVAINFLTVFMQILSVQNMQARFIDELENTDFCASVIKSEFDEAEQAGYQLIVTLYDTTQEYVLRDKEDVSEDLSNISLGKIELFFEFEIPLFGIFDERVLTAYAR